MHKPLVTLALLSVCAAATSATSYYHCKYLPRLHDSELAEQRQKNDLENAQRCRGNGMKFYTDYLVMSLSSSSEVPPPGFVVLSDYQLRTWNAAEMHFSKKLNTCGG